MKGAPLLALWFMVTLPLLRAEQPAAPAQPAAFVDITAECGVAEVLKARNVVPWEWHLVDLDGDGRLDLLISGRGGPWLAFHNEGNGRFALIDALSVDAQSKDANAPRGDFLALAFDFSEKGLPDLNYVHRIFHNETKSGSNIEWKFKPTSGGWGPGEAANVIADMNKDGIVDLIDNDKIYLRKADGTVDKSGAAFPNYPENSPIPVDLAGSGNLDLIVHGCEGGGMESGKTFYRKILRNDGKMNFTDVTKESGIDPLGGSIAGVGDVNQDGYPDLICIEPNPGAGVMKGNKVCIYLNDGKGHFTLQADAFGNDDKIVGQVRGYGGAVVTDVDNDGVADILLSINHWFYVFRGTGNGHFAQMDKAWGIDEHNAAYGPLGFGDIDGDGKLDVISGENKDMKIFRNNLPAKNWLNVRPVGLKGNRSAVSSKIRIYEPGDSAILNKKPLWYEQVAVWGRRAFNNYYASAQLERHFGLGERGSVDVSVEFYPSGKKVVRRGVKANATITVDESGESDK